MIRKISILAGFLFLSLISFSQIYDPVSWTFSYEKNKENEYDLILTATVEEGSHLYGMDVPAGGPIPTSFSFTESSDYELAGDVHAMSEGEIVFDQAFEMDIRYFSGEVVFRQTVRSELDEFIVEGYVNYMACDDEKCSPPQDEEFSINIRKDGVSAGASEAVSETEGDKLTGSETEAAEIAGDETETEEIAEVETEAAEIAGGETVSAEAVTGSSTDNRGLTGLLLVSFLLGIAAILTPCVFPMIPMTVAFFSQGTEKRSKSFIKALIFALSIVLIYSSLGVIISLTSAGAGFANTLSTHWIPNILFFTLFIVFAASFFGAYEIILPNKWVSSADSKVDRGGMVAAFFLGLTTVLVSFACTGPIVGALLVEAAAGDVLRPTVGMFGFGLGFALPFFLFALFPSVMSKMPKSGGWLNSVKVVLGFIMLAFSMKFLSTIDTVYGLNILTRDVFLSIWIVIFFLLGLYLMGKIKFAHDSDLKHIGIFRFLLIIAVFSFAVYLVPGLFGAPLEGVSGLIPSKSSSSFDLTKTGSPVVTGQAAEYSASGEGLCEEPKYAGKFELPYGLQGYFDLEQGLACAREKDMPVFIDFTAHACSNCKEMESKVWSDPEVLRRLANNFVIIALYCDDRTRLPEDEWITSAVDGKVKKTIGQVNANHEIVMFGTNTQPLYAITDHNGNPLVDPMGRNLDIDEYIQWLDAGYAAYER
ncbi:MAG: cytochrome c biogenesis protein CcdA [Bacteroidales bacterium]|nr:cytochrome c biogenesis protein CcdA [Bacteroidales bacterium]